MDIKKTEVGDEKNDPEGVGYWLYHVRTGMKGKSDGFALKTSIGSEKTEQVGRPASGTAYKVRRAIWKTLVSSNLSSAFRAYGHRTPGRKEVISLRLPDLSLAVFELLEAHFPFTDEYIHVLTAWSKLKNVHGFGVYDVRPLLYAERQDQLAFLKHVAETSWKRDCFARGSICRSNGDVEQYTPKRRERNEFVDFEWTIENKCCDSCASVRVGSSLYILQSKGLELLQAR